MNDAIERLKIALSERYAIERELGSGGMAFVYLAEDLKHGRKVALKLLRPELRQVVEGKRFLAEIHVTAKLHHPNILPLFDSGEIGGMLYYVMPYVDGHTLAERLDRDGPLPLEEAVFVATEVAKALDFAHQKGVIHRDVKPGNILLQAGQPLIGDFGIALGVGVDGQDRHTGQGLSVGTPEYMSPEQAFADGPLDGRSDVYSLACVLYEMLVGEPPHVAESIRSLFKKIVNDKPAGVSTRRSTVPASISEAIGKALEKNPADRFATAAEFAEALRGGARVTYSPSGGLRAMEPTRRRVKPFVFASMALIVSAAAIGFFAFLGSGAQVLSAGQTSRITNADGLELDPAISPDGDKLVFASGPLSAMKIHVQQLTGASTSLVLTDNISGHHRWPRWSPAGTEIAFLVNEPGLSAIRIVPAEGGTARTVFQTSGGEQEIFGFDWSPDGTQMVFGVRGGIHTVSIGGGEPRLLAGLVDGHSPSWSPDGSRIAFVSGNPTFVYGTFVLGNIAPSALWVATVSDGSAVRVTETTFLHTSPVWTPDGKSLVFVSNHDGRRDIYQLEVDEDGRVPSERIRLTTGLNAHTVTLASDASILMYSLLQMNANVWSIEIPMRGSISASTAVAVTDGNQTVEGMSVSADREWLAFDSDLNGTQDIYRMRLDGSASYQRLTTDPRDDFYPAWRSDGSKLAFYSFRTGKRDVWSMDADGSTQVRVTFDGGHNRAPQWSPDGQSIVYHSDKTGRAELFVVTKDLDSEEWGAPRRLTTNGGFNPHWSPDGQEIVYLESETVRVISAEGGEPRVMTELFDDPGVPRPWAVAWSPDGSLIYYKAFDSLRRSSFWSLPATGGEPQLLVSFDDLAFQSLRNEFATDGTKFFFTVGSHESDLWEINLGSAGDSPEAPEF